MSGLMGRRHQPHHEDYDGEYDPASEALVLLLERHQQQTEEAAVRAAASLNAVLLRGARPVPVGAGGTLTPTLATGTLMGYTLTATTAGTVTLRERDRDGQALWTLNLAAGQTLSHWFGPGGIALVNGLFLDATAGFSGSVLLRAGEDDT